jgi:hypothetical protein
MPLNTNAGGNRRRKQGHSCPEYKCRREQAEGAGGIHALNTNTGGNRRRKQGHSCPECKCRREQAEGAGAFMPLNTNAAIQRLQPRAFFLG